MKKLLVPFCLILIISIGSVGVSESADFQKGLNALQKKDYATALREWKPFAEQGHAPAQSGLGMMYFTGQDVSKDYKTAVKWFRLAAEQGHLLAQANLGWIHYKGIGVSQDHEIALKYHRLVLKSDAANKKQKDLVRGYIKNSEQELKSLKGK